MSEALKQYPIPQKDSHVQVDMWNAAILLNNGDDYLCGICGNICNKPMDIGCDKAHVYCSKCLDHYLQQNKDKTCILCKDKNFVINDKNIIHNKFVEKQINKLNVQCPYSQAAQMKEKCEKNEKKDANYDEGINIDDTQIKNYCEWIGIFGDIVNHINNDCKYKSMYNMIRCNYYKYGCNEMLKEKNISIHMQKNKLEHLELKMNYQFNNIIIQQNKKIEDMQQQLDIQAKAIELSKHNYLTLTSDSVFTAFNTNNNMSYKIPFKSQKWSKTSRHLCKYKDHKINEKLFPSLSKINHNLHVFFKLGIEQNVAYCLESLDSIYLPTIKDRIGSYTTLFTKKYGLCEFGGWNLDKKEPVSSVNILTEFDTKTNDIYDAKEEICSENNASFEWQTLTKMTIGRYYPSICEIENKCLFVAGGDNGEKFLDICEIYDYDSKCWKTLRKLQYPRRSGGCCYWKEKDNIVIGGGYDKTYMRKVELYDMNKDKWMKLSDTRYGHAGGPNISICYDFCNNGVIFIGGILSTAFQDMIECYDLRDSKQRWINVCDIGKKVGFKKESLDYNNRHLHSIFSI